MANKFNEINNEKGVITVNEKEHEQAFVMWKTQQQNGKIVLTGKFGNDKIIGYFNTMKKNPKEPDIRLYFNDYIKDNFGSLWVGNSDSGKKYLSGRLYNDKKVFGFIIHSEKPNAPYITVYYQEDNETDLPNGFSEIPDGVTPDNQV